jgi:selenocysteine-specific elongation factor
VRIRLSRPLVLDVFDRFVLRDAGRRTTVGGGLVLDPAPPARAGAAPERRLAARAAARREGLAALLVAERGAVDAAEVALLTGLPATPTDGSSPRVFAPPPRMRSDRRCSDTTPSIRSRRAPASRPRAGRSATPCGGPAGHATRAAVEAVLSGLESSGEVVRTASTVRLATHRVALEERGEDVQRLLDAIGGERETTPPTVQELVTSGISREVIDAADREGVVVRVSADLVITPVLAARAESLVRGATGGITVSAFRESLGTTRRYAVPILEWLDRRGVTRRDGDLRFPRG